MRLSQAAKKAKRQTSISTFRELYSRPGSAINIAAKFTTKICSKVKWLKTPKWAFPRTTYPELTNIWSSISLRRKYQFIHSSCRASPNSTILNKNSVNCRKIITSNFVLRSYKATAFCFLRPTKGSKMFITTWNFSFRICPSTLTSFVVEKKPF